MATATITTAIINIILPLDDDEFRGAEEKSVTKRRKNRFCSWVLIMDSNYLLNLRE